MLRTPRLARWPPEALSCDATRPAAPRSAQATARAGTRLDRARANQGMWTLPEVLRDLLAWTWDRMGEAPARRAGEPDPDAPEIESLRQRLETTEGRLRALLAGYHVHIAKPVSPAELVAVVAHLANERRDTG